MTQPLPSSSFALDMAPGSEVFIIIGIVFFMLAFKYNNLFKDEVQSFI